MWENYFSYNKWSVFIKRCPDEELTEKVRANVTSPVWMLWISLSTFRLLLLYPLQTQCTINSCLVFVRERLVREHFIALSMVLASCGVYSVMYLSNEMPCPVFWLLKGLTEWTYSWITHCFYLYYIFCTFTRYTASLYILSTIIMTKPTIALLVYCMRPASFRTVEFVQS